MRRPGDDNAASACDALNGEASFTEDELEAHFKAIAKEPYWAVEVLIRSLRDTWPYPIPDKCRKVFEQTILEDSQEIYAYAKIVLDGRWPEGEYRINKPINYPNSHDPRAWTREYIEYFYDQILCDLCDPNHEITPIDEIVIKTLASTVQRLRKMYK